MEKEKRKPYSPLPEYLTIGPSEIHGTVIFAIENIPGEVVIGITHVYDPNFQHGFIRTPLSRRKIASLLIRGFDKDQIYNIGCDVLCNSIPFGGFHD